MLGSLGIYQPRDSAPHWRRCRGSRPRAAAPWPSLGGVVACERYTASHRGSVYESGRSQLFWFFCCVFQFILYSINTALLRLEQQHEEFFQQFSSVQNDANEDQWLWARITYALLRGCEYDPSWRLRGCGKHPTVQPAKLSCFRCVFPPEQQAYGQYQGKACKCRNTSPVAAH